MRVRAATPNAARMRFLSSVSVLACVVGCYDRPETAMGQGTSSEADGTMSTDPSVTDSGMSASQSDPTGDPTGNPTGDPTGNPTGDPTSSPTSEPTTADTTDTGPESTETGVPTCDDVEAPCDDGQYCVAQACTDPPAGMVAVPAGLFNMGCNEASDPDCMADEFPYHEVFVSTFAISRTEVTADQFAACVDAGGCAPPEAIDGYGSPCVHTTGDLPVVCVDWFQANDYCESIGGRLPTEAEWEKASRGSDGRIYPWGDEPPTCNHAQMSGCEPTFEIIAVASKPAGASPYGALDMSGNVFEWVGDWYAAAYYVESPDTDPAGPGAGTNRVTRSAAPNYNGASMRSSFRGVDFEAPTPTAASGIVGFRCVFIP